MCGLCVMCVCVYISVCVCDVCVCNDGIMKRQGLKFHVGEEGVITINLTLEKKLDDESEHQLLR